jgi:hypothetical protein
MSNDPYILITADTHAGGSHAAYREYLDPKYRDAFDAWRGGYKNPEKQHYGSKKLRNWDFDIRSNDQNSQGVVGEVIFPNTVPPFWKKPLVMPPAAVRPEDYELYMAGIRAHNRWLKDQRSRRCGQGDRVHRRGGPARRRPPAADRTRRDMAEAAPRPCMGPGLRGDPGS